MAWIDQFKEGDLYILSGGGCSCDGQTVRIDNILNEAVYFSTLDHTDGCATSEGATDHILTRISTIGAKATKKKATDEVAGFIVGDKVLLRRAQKSGTDTFSVFSDHVEHLGEVGVVTMVMGGPSYPVGSLVVKFGTGKSSTTIGVEEGRGPTIRQTLKKVKDK